DNSLPAAAAAGLPDLTGFGGHHQAHHKSNNLQLWGNRESMNLNSMVLTNIKQSPYFKYELAEVSHLEPWERGTRRTTGLSGSSGGGLQVRGVGAGGVVSTAYCLLYKLFTLRLNRKQLQTLLDHPDSPFIRALGFMYIRYCLDPKELWEWYEPYFDDAEELDVKAGGGCLITIGEMLRQFLTQLDWYSTLFPRIPVPIEKDIRAKLQDRAAQLQRQRGREADGPARAAIEIQIPS
uniref:Pre-mRNA-splicing factor 38 n=1 Tax=Macrostomum lignano TaxID=282301 RepID=A0A1I8IPN5_9PLAT